MKYETIEKELEQVFKPKKKDSIRLAQSYKRLKNEKYYSRVKDCGTLLDWNSSHKLVNANFCKNRLCPTCNWRRSMKLGTNLGKVIDYLKKDYRFIFITLTVPNVKGDSLKETIDKMQKAFTNLPKNNINFRKSIKGYFKALEVTYNHQTKTYHPHFHLMCAVSHDYFDKTNKYYITKEYLLKAWRKEMNDPTIKVVWIQVCRNKKGDSGTKDLKSALLETAKYVVKSSDFLLKDKNGKVKGSYKETDEIVSTLTDALYKRRLTAFGGIMKKVYKMLQLDDGEDGDLVHIDDDSKDDAPDETIYRYIWINDNYILTYIFKPDGTTVDARTGDVIP